MALLFLLSPSLECVASLVAGTSTSAHDGYFMASIDSIEIDSWNNVKSALLYY